MIIYQTCPNRIYPTLAQALTGFTQDPDNPEKWSFIEDIKSFRYIYQYRDIYELLDVSQKTMILASQIGLIDYYPDYPLPRKYGDIKRRLLKDRNTHFLAKEDGLNEEERNKKDIELLFGVFPGSRLNNEGSKLKGDFSFTFLDHPVNQAYNIYYYLNFLRERLYNIISYPYKKYQRPDQESVSLQNILYCNFTKLYPTIENYIDNLIINKGKFMFNNYGIKFTIFPEHFGNYTSGYQDHDFYGIIESNNLALKSIEILNSSKSFKDINLEIKPKHIDRFLKRSSIIKNIDYRKDEVSNLLEEDIEFYNQKKKLIK